MRFVLVSVLVSVLAVAAGAEANSISLAIDPGPVGSSFSYADFDFGALSGSLFSGQSQSLDIAFSDGKLIAASSLDLELFINQTGAIGTWPDGAIGTFPSNYFSLTGYLLDSAGHPLGAPVALDMNVSMPAQVWPGWPFSLPDGTQYLPATTGYIAHFSGTQIGADPRDFFIDPIVASGIHLELTYPNRPADTVIGSRLQLSSYSSSPGFFDFTSPIYVSPDPVPEFHVQAPEPSSLVLLGLGLAAVVAARSRKTGLAQAAERCNVSVTTV